LTSARVSYESQDTGMVERLIGKDCLNGWLISQFESSAWACPLWVGWNEYPVTVGGVNRHTTWYTSPYLRSCSVRWCQAEGL